MKWTERIHKDMHCHIASFYVDHRISFHADCGMGCDNMSIQIQFSQGAFIAQLYWIHLNIGTNAVVKQLTYFSDTITQLTHFSRRPVPLKPVSHDATGGFRPWILILSCYVATVVTSLLFCFSTGQLEAWWSVYDEQACQPNKLKSSLWKYPDCGAILCQFVSIVTC